MEQEMTHGKGTRVSSVQWDFFTAVKGSIHFNIFGVFNRSGQAYALLIEMKYVV